MSTSTQHFADPGQVHERRLHPRIFPKTLVYVACGASNGGMVLNASDDGMAISMAIAVGAESLSNLLVRMNGLPQSIEVSGRIAWTSVSRKRAGIQLLEVNDTQRAGISEWLAYEGIREVHLVPQEASKIVAPVAPVFDETRYSLLQAFGGTAPESLGPAPSLVDHALGRQETSYQQAFPSGASAETQPAQDLSGSAQNGFRDNEWDLADVSRVPRKKSSRVGLPAFALIFLWIAIPCFGVGMLVGRRPLQQWLAHGDAHAENVSQVVTRVSEPVNSGDQSTQDAALTRVHVDATNYPVSDSTAAAPLPRNASAALLNPLSTQEVRAIRKPSVTITAPPQPPAIANLLAAEPEPASASSFRPSKPAPVPTTAVSAPVIAAAPLRRPDAALAASVSDAPSRNAQAGTATSTVARDGKNSSIQYGPADLNSRNSVPQNYDEGMPRTLSVDSGLAPRSAAKISTPGSAQPAASAATPSVPTMTARSAPGASAPPPARSLSASAPNPAPARPVSPSRSPSIAPLFPQPALHGVMLVARKSDESFLLKLPLESVAGDRSNTSVRMQRFVMVPKESRWHRHGPIVKLTIGELLAHDVPPSPRAMNTGAGDVITVRAFIDKNGAVEDLKPVSGRFALLPRVMRSVRDWQFDRTLLDGKPVESEVNVTMEFRPAR